MLTLFGSTYRLCDRLSRRQFLHIGALGASGLTLSDLFAAESGQARRSTKSVIMVFLPGGPSHLDTVDPKPEAPPEIRGQFEPIATAVPGIRLCEHLPHLAGVMDKLIVMRSVVGGVDQHASHMCLTGYPQQQPQPTGGWPTVGAVASRLLGPARPGVPPFVGLAARMLHAPYNDPGPGFLGVGHAAFTPDGASRSNLVLKTGRGELQKKVSLLGQFDRLRRDLDGRGLVQGMDAVRQQALGVLTSARLREALDLSKEDPRTRDLYGPGIPELVEGFNAAPRLTEQFLLARRLVEAGARCVTLAFGAWDWHEKNFPGHKEQLPYLDRGLAALVTDLHQRSLSKDVAVVAWGEFGRSPRINKSAGRDHWPAVSCALLAGGGFRTGQVLGSTNRLGETAKDRPVHFREVMATLYHHLGINVATTTLPDLSGRPQFLAENYRAIAEIL